MLKLLNAKSTLVMCALLSVSMTVLADTWGGGADVGTFGGSVDSGTSGTVVTPTQNSGTEISTVSGGGGGGVGDIGGGGNGDITRREMLKQWIKYDATERFKVYALNKELLFMEAPGTAWALNAANAISKSASDFERQSRELGEKGLLTTLKNYTHKQDFTFHNINVQDLPSNIMNNFYTLMSPFVLNGETDALKNVNSTQLMAREKINKDDLTSAVQLMSLLTNPFPVVDTEVKTFLENPTSELGGVPEKLSRYFAQSASVGLSSSAIGDIIARRVVSDEGKNPKSVMQVMKNYGEKRFADPDWVNALAGASEAAILREIAQMQSYAIWMQYQQYRLDEQQVALLSSLNANITRLTGMIEKFTAQIQNSQDTTNTGG